MNKQITIQGKDGIDLMEREKALEKVQSLSTQELKNLASLAESDKARKYLSDPIKFKTLKTFL